MSTDTKPSALESMIANMPEKTGKSLTYPKATLK